jgi:hypothetical protein
MTPANILEFRGRPPRRSVLAAHRRIVNDFIRQMDRFAAGRFVWCPMALRYLAHLRQKDQQQ